jgi:membrane protease YdiL (CAAX protease family)
MEKKLPKYFLYVGIAITVVCFPTFFFLDIQKLPMSEFLNVFPPLFFLGIFMIMPFLEEIAFRSWLLLNKKYLSIIGFSLFVSLVFINQGQVFLIIISTVILTLVYVKFKTNYTKYADVGLIIVSSIAFGLTHLHNEDLNLSSLAFLGYYSGLGLCLAYVRWNYGLRYSIIWHYGFNVSVLLISFSLDSGFYLGRTKNISINNENIKGTLTKHSILNTSIGSMSIIDEDTIKISNSNLGQIGLSLISCDTCLVNIRIEPYTRYSFVATKKEDITEKIQEFCREYFIQNGYFEIDTIKKKSIAILLKIKDTSLFYDNQEVGRLQVSNIASTLQNSIKKVVLVDSNYRHKFIDFSTSDIINLSRVDEKSALKILKEKYSISYEYKRLEITEYVVK